MSISMRIATFFLLHGVMLSVPFALTSMSTRADAEAAEPVAVESTLDQEVALAVATVN